MDITLYMEQHGHEQLVVCQDRSVGLKAFIAIHDTTLGPALGGTRMWPYRSEEEAVIDVLRLAKGMTYKASVAGLNLGGGKAVIMGDPGRDKTPQLLQVYGRFVETLNGRYITAEDVGTCQQDMDIIRTCTRHVCGVAPENGGSGDPSPFTALGVFHGIRAAVRETDGRDDLAGLKVAVQGLGHVGYHLCHLLAEAGAKLVVTDIHQARVASVVAEFGAEAVEPEAIYVVDCDVFAPCALGAVVNDRTVKGLRCRIIAGAANNVLAEPYHGELLESAGILYVPDYVINAGGLINVAEELNGYNARRSTEKVCRIYDRVREVITLARSLGVSTHQAADCLAEQRIRAAREGSQHSQEVSLVG